MPSGHSKSKKTTRRHWPEFLAVARRRADTAEHLRQVYVSGLVPFGVLARFGGVTSIDLWDELRNRDDTRLIASTGLAGEAAASLAALAREEGPWVIDPLTLYALSQIGIAQDVLAALPEVAIVQSGIDMLMAAHHERELNRGQRVGSLLAEGDRFRFVEAAPETIEATIASVAAALALARDLPSVAPEHPSTLTSEAWEILDLPDQSLSDTVRYAKETGALLVTDDIALRRIAELEGVSCVWSHLVLSEGRRRGRVANNRFVGATLALLATGIHYVSVDPGMLIGEWQNAGQTVSAKLGRLLDQLADRGNDPGSVVGVLADFLMHAAMPVDRTDPIADLLADLAARFHSGLSERAGPVLLGARNLIGSRLRRGRRQSRLPGSLMATTALVSTQDLAAKIDAMSDRDFDDTLGHLLDTAFA